MALKNAIQIVISAVDNASNSLKRISGSFANSAKKMQDWALRNDLILTRVSQTSKEIFGKLARYTEEYTEKAGKTQEAEDAMGRLAKKMNLDSNKIMQSLRKASKGTVANYDLILAANKAMSLGVTKNTEEFTTLMEIARVKSKNMGISTTQAFNDIVTGLGRGSAMILDNLGIVVDAEKAYYDYAKSIGKSAKDLTNAEKKQAIINSTVEAGKKEVKEMGDIALTTAERKALLTAQIENLKDSIGKALLPTINQLIENLGPLIKKFGEWAEQNPDILRNIILITGAASGLVSVLSGIGLLVGPIGTTLSTLSTILKTISTSMTALSAGGGVSLKGLLLGINPVIAGVIAALVALFLAYKTNFLGFRDGVNDAIKSMGPYFEIIRYRFQQIKDILKQFWDRAGPHIKAFSSWLGDTIYVLFIGIVATIEAKLQSILIIIKTRITTFNNFISFWKNIFTGNWKGAWENIKNIFSARINAYFQMLGAFLGAFSSKFQFALDGVGNRWKSRLNYIKNIAGDIFNRIADKVSRITNKISRAKSAVENIKIGAGKTRENVKAFAGRAVGGRASGGNMIAGQLYRINEIGAEYFRPAINGRMERQNQASASFNINFGSVVINNGMDLAQFEERIRNVIYKEQQRANLGYF